jgi:SAM-dependent methyltransferase
MEQPAIRFDDGAAYEDFMGAWSRPVGEVFLDWLAPPAGWRWADVGCGNGAFSEMLLDRTAPSEVHGIDPSHAQLAFARTRLPDRPVRFTQGDAMALPLADASVDAAVMALVIFFVPEPARGVAEMARVVRPGGGVSAYSWDLTGGGFPYAALREELAAIGVTMAWPPQPEASRIDVMHDLWTAAGLVDLQTREITVERSFTDFDTFWRAAQKGPRVAPQVGGLSTADAGVLTERLRARFPPDAEGRIRVTARAGAIQGRRPG